MTHQKINQTIQIVKEIKAKENFTIQKFSNRNEKQTSAVVAAYKKDPVLMLIDLFSGLSTVKEQFIIKDSVIDQQENLRKEITEILNMLTDEIEDHP